MKCVEFFVQNRNQPDLVSFERNWNIRNIANTILTLNQQLGNGVTSYYLRMEKNGNKVIIHNDAIRINQEILTESVEDFFEDGSANELFEAFMDAQYEDYLDTTICVHVGDNLIQFVSEHIAVNEFDPVADADKIQAQWVRDSNDKMRHRWYILRGPKAGHYILMTYAEAASGKIDGELAD